MKVVFDEHFLMKLTTFHPNFDESVPNRGNTLVHFGAGIANVSSLFSMSGGQKKSRISIHNEHSLMTMMESQTTCAMAPNTVPVHPPIANSQGTHDATHSQGMRHVSHRMNYEGRESESTSRFFECPLC